MQVFYSDKISNKTIIIDGQEHIHLSKVLRKGPGDQVHVCNGKGLMLRASIVSSTKKESILHQEAVEAEQDYNPNKLVLAVAPTKNIDRYQWMIEKCTEIGIKTVIPFYSHHSERRRLKVERLRLNAIAAMKQSKSLFLPEIIEPMSFKELLRRKGSEQKYIAFMGEKQQQLKQVISSLNKDEELLIAIGPEGGFSTDEVNLAKEHGYTPISLGPKRLRTETAGVFCAVAYQIL